MSERTFKLRMSERCFRFKPEALDSHAPRRPGIFEFVIFDSQLTPIVLYVGLASPQTLYDALSDHLMARRRPSLDDLQRLSKDVYFDYVDWTDGSSADDLQDIAAQLCQRHKPRLNSLPHKPTGRYERVACVEQ